MLNFVGLDLSGERIRHTTATVDEQEDFAAPPSRELAAALMKPAWEDAEKSLQIKSSMRLHNDLDRNKLNATLSNRFAAAQLLVRDSGQVTGIGLAVPYCTAARTRQGFAEIALGSPTVKVNSVWETPIATAIDAYLVQSAHLNPQGQRQLVISPSPWGIEVTQLQLSGGESSRLHVQLESIQEFFEEDAAAKLAEAATTLRKMAQGCGLTVVGAETNPLVALAADIVGTGGAVTLRDASEAVARLAAMEDRQRLLGSPYTHISLHRILGRALGLVCQNQKGDLFWRQLFKVGASFDAGLETILQLSSPPTDRRVLLLADVRSPAPSWATLQDEKSVIARFFALKDQKFLAPNWKLQAKCLGPKWTGLPNEAIEVSQLPANRPN